MIVPVREVGVVAALSLLSFLSADGLAKVADRFDRKSGRTAYEVAMLDSQTPKAPRSPQELIEYWDEFTRCPLVPAYRIVAGNQFPHPDEAL